MSIELVLCVGFPGMEGLAPHTRPTARSTAGGPGVTRRASGGDGNVPLSKHMSCVFSSGLHILSILGILLGHSG